jgi:dipeptidyl aminopeptidase/acylaminoacyl peptidase
MKYVFLLLLVVCGATVTQADDALIPRQILFGNPDRAAVRLSHDGKFISYLAPRDGVLNVWVAPIDKPTETKPVTADKTRGIQIYSWAYNNQHILYLQDEGGNENWNVHAVELSSGKDVNLTPDKNVSAKLEHQSAKFPDEVLVGLNDRSPQFHDLWRINVRTGEKKLVCQNPGTVDGGMVAGMVTDDDLALRYLLTFTPDGGQELFQPVQEPQKQDGTPGWESFMKIPMADVLNTSPEAFQSNGTILYMTDSRGRDTGVLKMLNLKSGDERVLAEDPHADAGAILFHPATHEAQAVQFNYERPQWTVIDQALENDFAVLRNVPKNDSFGEADFEIASRTLDDRLWVVAYMQDDGPVRYYLYDHHSRQPRFLFTNRAALENVKLARMQSRVIKSRDGLDLVSYLTLPPASDPDGDGIPDHPLPMVLNVHGGPWGRDNWGFNPLHQWLANRGYAVLSVNFRGSTGLGKHFVNAANREWGGKMHDDLIDAVNAVVEKKIADPAKVAIMGGSYGGYATLVGLTFTPDQFACGVDIVGPSNINTLLATIPPYWAPAMALWKTRVGDNSNSEGRAFLDSRSPLTKVANIAKPLLIGQGANDPRVKQSESDQIVKAMQAKNIPVTYVLYPDEGHGFQRPENRTSFFAVTEAFLAKQLGGRYEPVGDDFKGSTIHVPAGADQVPGLKDAPR